MGDESCQAIDTSSLRQFERIDEMAGSLPHSVKPRPSDGRELDITIDGVGTITCSPDFYVKDGKVLEGTLYITPDKSSPCLFVMHRGKRYLLANGILEWNPISGAVVKERKERPPEPWQGVFSPELEKRIVALLAKGDELLEKIKWGGESYWVRIETRSGMVVRKKLCRGEMLLGLEEMNGSVLVKIVREDTGEDLPVLGSVVSSKFPLTKCSCNEYWL